MGKKSRKRPKASPYNGDQSSCKRVKTTDASPKFDNAGGPKDRAGLLSLSDDILLDIFADFDCVTLDALSGTCARLRCLVEDRRLLWSLFDLSAMPLMAPQLLPRFRFLHAETHTFRACGYAQDPLAPHSSNITMSRFMLALLQTKCPHLRKLELFSAGIFDTKLTFAFPHTLEELTLVRVRYVGQTVPLSISTSNMSQLHTIRLEYCSWFRPCHLKDIGKMEHLQTLSLRGCPMNEKECGKYFDGRIYFQRLKSLDLRYTWVKDYLIKRILLVPSLRELFLRAPRRLPSTRISDKSIGTLQSRMPFVYLERLMVRDYSHITNVSLQHLAEFAPRLRTLDVCGTGVFRDDVLAFRALRPDCELLASEWEVRDPEESNDEEPF